MSLESITIFTDGSSRGNPGPGGYAAVIVHNDSELKVIELGGRVEHTTNNRMELQAAISALSSHSTLHATRFTLYTDSSYVVNGITKWVFGWRKNNWITSQKKPVENRDLWEKLVEVSERKKIEWKQIGGHVGVAGNVRCDEIATAFADNKPPQLYSGNLPNYSIKNILDIAEDKEAKDDLPAGKAGKRETRSRQNQKAYSYVSRVGGVIHIDKTWAECEARVKGKGGARYKKVFSSEEEKSLVSDWSNAR